MPSRMTYWSSGQTCWRLSLYFSCLAKANTKIESKGEETGPKYNNDIKSKSQEEDNARECLINTPFVSRLTTPLQEHKSRLCKI